MKPIQLDGQQVDYLVRSKGNRLISIAIPTHVRGRETSQDRIQLKNKLAKVDSVLEEHGVRRRERQGQLADAKALLDDDEFWEHQHAQLAIYIDDSGDTVPIAVSQQTKPRPSVVSPVFHMRHILPDLNPSKLPVLVLTGKAVALYELTRRGLTESDADLPESFDDVNWFVDRERQRQQHPDRVGTSRNRHGHDPATKENEDTARFLRAVRDALPGEANGEPLVVLGDDNLVKRFENLFGGEILSPENSGIDDLSKPAIFDRAAPELERHQSLQVSEVIVEALDELGAGNATTELSEALSDAASGRLSRVVLYRDENPVWGHFEPESLVVETREAQEYGAMDLIDRLVATSYEMGAEITVTESVIGDNLFVAVRRF